MPRYVSLAAALVSCACSGKQTGDEGENRGLPNAMVENHTPLRPSVENVGPKGPPSAETQHPTEAEGTSNAQCERESSVTLSDGGYDGGCKP